MLSELGARQLAGLIEDLVTDLSAAPLLQHIAKTVLKKPVGLEPCGVAQIGAPELDVAEQIPREHVLAIVDTLVSHVVPPRLAHSKES